MTANVHRALTALLGSLTGIVIILEKANPSELGVSDIVWTWVGISMAISIVVATAWRQAYDS